MNSRRYMNTSVQQQHRQQQQRNRKQTTAASYSISTSIMWVNCFRWLLNIPVDAITVQRLLFRYFIPGYSGQRRDGKGSAHAPRARERSSVPRSSESSSSRVFVRQRYLSRGSTLTAIWGRTYLSGVERTHAPGRGEAVVGSRGWLGGIITAVSSCRGCTGQS